MKVFISWSGRQSKALADALSSWLPRVIQAAQPYYSDVDIEKGKRWNEEITKELSECHLGLVCVTRDNLNAPWLMFEAGALSKSMAETRVVPLLFGLKTSDITYPLAQFQAAAFSKAEMRKVLNVINRSADGGQLDNVLLDEQFDMWWPRLEVQVEEILAKNNSNGVEAETVQVMRSDRELLEEILGHVRAESNATAIRPSARFTARFARDVIDTYCNIVYYAAVEDDREQFDRSIRMLGRIANFIVTRASGIDDEAVSKFRRYRDELEPTVLAETPLTKQVPDDGNDVPF